jgi:uncharacterized protein with FMN-binding domain
MPRRAIVAISSTALALALLFSFKTPDDRTGSTVGTANEPLGVVAGASLSPTGTAGPAASAAPRATDRPAGTAAPAATAAPASGTLKDGTVTGPVVTTRFGPVQVQVTIAGGQVTDISAVELPSDHPRSQAISQYAEPILRTEAVQAQSAQIDLVSGATYTSIAYERSLQAALDQAHG